MAYILSIETATSVCSVGLSHDGRNIAIRESAERNVHASKVAVFIEEVLRESGVGAADLSAVAISKGPGSYTGLRIGVSSAKGICYAADLPLISINTLQAISARALDQLGTDFTAGSDRLLPMLDARRMEVYSAIYDGSLEEIEEPGAFIVDTGSFGNIGNIARVFYFGNGAAKCKAIFSDRENFIFLPDLIPSATYLAPLAAKKYHANEFENLAYFEPFYLKDFIAGAPKVKGLKL
jgi:tRNA threonylcarbamoyladenosine biosynthesis protein TsaB